MQKAKTKEKENLLLIARDAHLSPPAYTKIDLVYLFCIGGLIGTLYEVFLIMLRDGLFEDRRGSILTPFNYVYGTGAVFMVLMLYKIRNKPLIFLIGSLFGGAFEYLLCYLQEQLLGCRSWDYSEKILNINGRTSIPCMIIWGMLCLAAISYIFPFLIEMIHKMPERRRLYLGFALLWIILFDAFLSLMAVIRYVQRFEGFYFKSSFFRFFDSVFSDKFMHQHFPNMILK